MSDIGILRGSETATNPVAVDQMMQKAAKAEAVERVSDGTEASRRGDPRRVDDLP